MVAEATRALVAGAIRTALENGLREAEDPVAYLSAAREEMRALAGSLAAAGLDETAGLDEEEDYDIQVMVVQEVSRAIAEMLHRLRH